MILIIPIKYIKEKQASGGILPVFLPYVTKTCYYYTYFQRI
jgi:hypothetical protein